MSKQQRYTEEFKIEAIRQVELLRLTGRITNLQQGIKSAV